LAGPRRVSAGTGERQAAPARNAWLTGCAVTRG